MRRSIRMPDWAVNENSLPADHVDNYDDDDSSHDSDRLAIMMMSAELTVEEAAEVREFMEWLLGYAEGYLDE